VDGIRTLAVLVYPPLHCVALLWRRSIAIITNTHSGASCKRGQQHSSCNSGSVAGQGESHHGTQLQRGRTANKGLGNPGGRDRVAHEFGRSRNRERVTKELERTHEADARAEGEGGIYGHGESSDARAPTPCLIRRPLNPRGQTPRLRL
jgi:hypothetical protein